MTIPFMAQGSNPALTPSPAQAGRDVYDVVLIDDAFAPIDRLDKAIVASFAGDRLPNPTSAEVWVPEASVGLNRLDDTDGRPKVLYPWFEVRRRGVCRFRGYPHRYEADSASGMVRIELRSLADLASRVTVSEPERTNHLTNGDFESGTTGWTAYGTATMSSTSFSRKGTKGVLVQGGADGGWISKVATLTINENDRSFYVACWMYVPTGQRWGYGIVADRFINGGPLADDDRHGPKVPDDKVGATGEWVRLLCRPMLIPGQTTGTAQIESSLYVPPGGAIFFDDVQVVQADNESVPHGGDPAQFVAYLYRRAFEKLGVPINVTWEPTGEVLEFGARADHSAFGEVAQLVSQWPQVEAVYDPRLNKLLCGPRVGRARTGLVLGRTWAGQPTTWAIDSSNVAKVVHSLGDDDGQPTTRPVGSYEEPAAQVPVEFIDTEAPAGLGPKELAQRAESVQAQRSQAALSVTGVLPVPHGGTRSADWLDEGLGVGDSLRCRVDFGPWTFAETVRVASWRVRPQAGDVMEVDLVPDDVA